MNIKKQSTFIILFLLLFSLAITSATFAANDDEGGTSSGQTTPPPVFDEKTGEIPEDIKPILIDEDGNIEMDSETEENAPAEGIYKDKKNNNAKPSSQEETGKNVISEKIDTSIDDLGNLKRSIVLLFIIVVLELIMIMVLFFKNRNTR